MHRPFVLTAATAQQGNMQTLREWRNRRQWPRLQTAPPARHATWPHRSALGQAPA